MEYPIHPQVQKLMEIPQPEQRSPEWFEARSHRLTSSDVDTVLGNSKYASPDDVLFKKCDLGKPFFGNVATRHGQKYEDEAIEHYCRIYNKKNHVFGLLPHPTISWLGGSPDDITHDGIVIEVKCPLYRKIIMGECPKHYEAQVRMNMEICDLDRAVFIEYRPASDKGPMILNVVNFERDPQWMIDILPTLDAFWKGVLHYRKEGIETHTLYDYYYGINNPKKIVNLESEPECTLRCDNEDIVVGYESDGTDV
jgi:putative phage-type endonuclease